MAKFFVSRPATILIFFGFLLGTFAACQKKTEVVEEASPSPSQSSSSRGSVSITPEGPTGPVQPAIVGQDAESFAHYLHFPKDSEAAKLDSAVQFYCDIAENGVVVTTYALIGNNDAFKAAVQAGLDWGRFEPATVGGTPVAAYLGGTVLFLHQDGAPVIVVSLATHDRARVGKLTNYIQPQLIGGLRRRLEKADDGSTLDVPFNGGTEVVVKVNDQGGVISTNVISENPQDSGTGEFVNSAMKAARFTPAYSNGKATEGAINVVANLGEF